MRMWFVLIALVAAAIARGGPPATAPEALTQLHQILADYEKDSADFQKRYAAATTDAERAEIAKSYPQATKYLKPVMELAQANRGTLAARDALMWIVSHSNGGPELDEAMKQLAEDHATDSRVGHDLAQQLAWSPSPAARTLLEAVIEKNSDRQTQAYAKIALARYLTHHSDNAGERIFEEVARDYGDIANGRLRKEANSELFEIHNLAVGKTAPPITGQDVTGKPMALSDFAGKVIVLDFFGDW